MFSSKNPQEILIDIIVDDGIENKLKRESLFSDNYKFIVCGINENKEFGNIIVLVLTGGIAEKDSLYFNYHDYKYNYSDE